MNPIQYPMVTRLAINQELHIITHPIGEISRECYTETKQSIEYNPMENTIAAGHYQAS